MTHKDKKILLALCGRGVVLFKDFSDPFSKTWSVLSGLWKASCLDCDVREQDRPCGNTDDRTLLTPVNLKAVGFPDSTWLYENLNLPQIWLFRSLEYVMA